MGVSRDTFYRYQELVETDGLGGLLNRERRVPNLKNRVDENTEKAVISYAVDFPAHGQQSLSEFLCERSHTMIMSFNRKDSYDDTRPIHPGQAD